MASILKWVGSFSLGPVGTVLMAIWSGITTFLGWLISGITVCVSHPATAAVLFVTLVGGVWLGIRWDGDKLRTLQTEMVQANADSKKRLAAANAARQEAESKVMAAQPLLAAPVADVPAVPPPAPVVKRVHYHKNNCGGSWLPSVSALFGFCK